jgi:tetratricopeptide (TPR) repeat protein
MVDVLIQRGILAVYQNDLPRAFACFGESLALCEEFGYSQGRALALVFLGHAALFNMQWDEQAKARCEQALEVFKELDDKTDQAHAHIILGTGAHFEGDDHRARAHLEQAVRLCRQLGDKRQLGWSTAVLSLTMRWQGRLGEAFPMAKEALRLALELGERTIAVNAILFLALFEKDRGQMERATRLSSCGFALGESFGFRPTPTESISIQR